MGTLYDRNRGPTPNPQVPMTEIPLSGDPLHVTPFDPSSPYRVSWDTRPAGDQGQHYTNQNLPYGHPARHTPPPATAGAIGLPHGGGQHARRRRV